MKLGGIPAHFAGWREWELNPIVIKELRQAVRSWTVTSMLLLFLTILFLTSLGFLIAQSFEPEPNLQLGGTIFSVFLAMLTVASTFFIPLYIGVRVALERQEGNIDLLYASTLSPASIIRGKFLCGAYVTALFFSACMPFMVFTNLLRGVDLPTVFFILGYVFLVVCAATMIAIFLACLPTTRPFKILLALAGFLTSLWIVVPLIIVSFEFMRSGIGARMGERLFWIGTLTGGSIGLAVVGLFFVLSVALISPQSANRALPVRLYVTGIWLLGALLGCAWVAKSGSPEDLLSWTYPALVLMLLSLLVTISNSDTLSPRVRRTIPTSRFKRALAFLFYNGAAGGLIWVAALVAATLVLTRAVSTLFPAVTTGTPADATRLAAVSAYAFAFALTALFLHRAFLGRRPPKLAGLLAMLVAGAAAVAPTIVLFLLNHLSWKSVERLQLGNVFNVLYVQDPGQERAHLYFASAWLLAALVLNAKWFLRQVKAFQPPGREPIPEPPPVLPPEPPPLPT